MPQTDTKRSQVILNTLKKAEFDAATKDQTQLYGLTDTHELYLGSTALSRNTAYEAATNCVTFIPQDIKLELISGTITLKAGSKVYFPNGSGGFNPITISGDLTLTSSSNGKKLLFAGSTGSSSLIAINVSSCVSGATDSLAGQTYHVWYDTANNDVKYYGSNGSTVSTHRSLPIAVITVSGGSITSVDQVFNGFGYIGSTIFSLPGVRGLYPNGRNSDGTLASREITTSTVLTYTEQVSGNRFIMLRTGNLENFINVSYDKYRNVLYNTVIPLIERAVCGTFTRGADGTITNFNPKVVFRAADFNDLEDTKASLATVSTNLSNLDSSAVHKNINETITSLKTLDTGSYTVLKTRSNVIDNTVTPTAKQSSNYIDGEDKNGVRLTRIYTAKDINGDNILSLQAWDGATNYSVDVHSLGYATAPTPQTATDNSTKIATTAWVRNHRCTAAATTTSSASIDAPAYVVENYRNNDKWYRVWSDGWIEQGGSSTVSSGVATVTLLKAMTDSDYFVMVSNRIDSSGDAHGTDYAPLASNRTTTGFRVSSDFKFTWLVCGY